MATAIPAAFPYINVQIDTSGLQPRASRAVGNLAIVGDAGGLGNATANVPTLISSEKDARDFAASTNAAGAITGESRLYRSLRDALLQDPAPSRLYAVATEGDEEEPDYASGLAPLAALDVQFVCLAQEPAVGEDGPPATGLTALKEHVESVSADGKRRMAVAMVDPDLTRTDEKSYAEVVDETYEGLKSDTSRMVLVTARVARDDDDELTSDVAAAAAGAIAGQSPHASVLLKRLRQVKIPVEQQFGPSDIKQLSEKNVVPVIDPELVPGEGLHFAAGRTYTTDTSRLYIDIVRVLDHVEFELRAGLIGSIGSVRIDRPGIQTLSSRITSILAPLREQRMIDDFSVYIPIFPALLKAGAERTPSEDASVTDARSERKVDVLLSITYGPAVHVLDLDVALKF